MPRAHTNTTASNRTKGAEAARICSSSSRRQRLAPSPTTGSSAGEQLPLRGTPLDVGLQDAEHDAEDDEADQDTCQGIHLETHGWIWMVDRGGGVEASEKSAGS